MNKTRIIALSTTCLIALATACLGGSPVNTTQATVGELMLYVRGGMSDVVLTDPSGRVDQQNDSVAIANIPGCDRSQNPPDGDEVDPELPKSSRRPLTLFTLDIVEYGRYLISAQAQESLEVEVLGTYHPADDAPTGCVELGRKYRVGPGRSTWAVDVRRSPPKGECTIRILRLPKATQAGRVK